MQKILFSQNLLLICFMDQSGLNTTRYILDSVELKGDRSGGLPVEVLRALRSVGLLDARVRRAN
jgi:hypothetical protein